MRGNLFIFSCLAACAPMGLSVDRAIDDADPLFGETVSELPVAQASAPVGTLTMTGPDSLYSAANATFTFSGLYPEEQVYLMRTIASSLGPGVCPRQTGRACFGITGNPRLVGTTFADGAGNAAITIPVQAIPPGLDWGFQAVAVRGYSGANSLFSNPLLIESTLILPGCTDSSALNYDPSANLDDGSCLFAQDYDFGPGHTFTSCGASGRTGPSLAQCQGEYSSTTWAGDTDNFDVLDGIQLWTVPASGDYRIVVRGAQGGDTTASGVPGLGARVEGTFSLTQGDVLQILVGQRSLSPILNSGGGGGGSFVVTEDDTPLIIAGGGGGATNTAAAGGAGQVTESGGVSGSGELGGTGGNGGASGTGTTGYGSGGGGFTTDGQHGDNATFGTRGGLAFLNGGQGGFAWDTTQRGHDGGFGGGGGCGNYGGGGGGGYSGGGAGRSNGFTGGGGGSFNSGSNPAAFAGDNTGMGSVTITPL